MVILRRNQSINLSGPFIGSLYCSNTIIIYLDIVEIFLFPSRVLKLNGIVGHLSLDEVMEKTTCCHNTTLSPDGVVRGRPQYCKAHFQDTEASLNYIPSSRVLHVEVLFFVSWHVTLPPYVKVIPFTTVRY